MKTPLQTIKNIINYSKTGFVIAIIGALPLLTITPAHASPITGRSVTLSNSAGDASGVTYTVATAALPTATAVKSVQVQLCTAASGACTTPTGFTAISAGLASQPTGLGATSGWTLGTATTGSLRIANAANATVPSGALSITFNAVHNPTATNTTFYAVITTYSDAAWTTPIDTGTVALSTSALIQVSLSVNEALTFCAGVTITGTNCGTISGSTVSLGTGSTTATSNGTSVLAASTNGASGYSVTVSGSTLTAGANTITALTSNAASAVGTRQFGLNLVSNSTPPIGSLVTGTGTATVATNYSTTNSFRFGSGETIASVAGPSNANTFTVSYIANLDGTTPPGAYTSNLTYIATANF